MTSIAKTDRLPERVVAAIRRREEQSEILIGWVHFAVVMTFTTIYALTPRAADSDLTMFQPVPTVLTLYFSFTVFRLIISYTRQTPAWFLYLSIVIDITLLLGLIWSFHIQYDQPPSFYLKAPTVMYLFIFIALRALRFDAGYVIVTGVVAALGWLALLGYALYFGPEEPSITRDYVTYMTSNQILLGAEGDKVISILMVTLILAVALIRGRALLVTAVIESAAARDLKRFFAPETARAITGAQSQIAAGEGELRDVAVLMVDIRGFSHLTATMSPGAVMRLLSDYHARVVPVIVSHGGSIDKYLGDGVMATFGASEASDSHAADALRALDDIVAAMRDWTPAGDGGPGVGVAVNGAVATGPAVVGAVGDEQRLEYTVIGTSVNLAAKLEKHNKKVGAAALTTAETYDMAVSQNYQPSRPARRIQASTVSGLDEPVDLIVLAPAQDNPEAA